MALALEGMRTIDSQLNINRSMLENAILNNELCLYYQPRFNVVNHQVMVLEALVRWVHPKYGLILPDEFIPLAENTGLIHSLGQWVISQSCRDINLFYASGIMNNSVRTAINVSILQCEQPNTVNDIKKIIHNHKLTLSHFEFELTESIKINNEQAVIDFCTSLSDDGAEISLDDFGTGHSSLTHLSHIPAHALKIDKQFVAQLKNNHRDRILLKQIIHMGHELGVRVVAEGIENEKQMQLLIKMGCDELQGFYICRPVRRQALSLWYSGSKTTTKQKSILKFPSRFSAKPFYSPAL